MAFFACDYIMSNYQTNTALLLTALIAFTSCGTKGPLYIPEQRYPQPINQPAANDNHKLDAEKAAPAQPITKE